MCSIFILSNVLVKAKTITSLIKLNMLERNIQKVTTEVRFGLKSYLKDLKKEKKVKESEVHLFLQEVKQFLATLYMAEYPDTCKKLFDKILEKLVI